MKQTPDDSRIGVLGRSIRAVLLSTDAGASELLPAEEQRGEAISSYVRTKSVSINLD